MMALHWIIQSLVTMLIQCIPLNLKYDAQLHGTVRIWRTDVSDMFFIADCQLFFCYIKSLLRSKSWPTV